MTVLRFKPSRQTGPTQFHRHLAIHMANAELHHERAIGRQRQRRPRWSGWLMAFALGFVIWALISRRIFFP